MADDLCYVIGNDGDPYVHEMTREAFQAALDTGEYAVSDCWPAMPPEQDMNYWEGKVLVLLGRVATITAVERTIRHQVS